MAGGIDWNDISLNSNGGTELMCKRLESAFPKEFLDNFQIIPSRVGNLDETKIRVLWAHDLPIDAQHLRDGGWRKFHKIVFVSHWQKEWYVRDFQIPYSRVAVLQNAILPIDKVEKPSTEDSINLIYHTTPHRGLDILYTVVNKLAEEYPNIKLDVYSSFKIYGWEQRDEQFQELFDRISNHANMNYYGFVPNDKIREALQQAHIFAYPNTWMETSCLAMMEAMSAGCHGVHPDFGALPETTANWTFMYPFDEDKGRHAAIFYAALKAQIKMLNSEGQKLKIDGMKNYVDVFHNWELRKGQWKYMLETLLDENPNRGIEEPTQELVFRSI
jgi:UDP-glucose:(glucosyl)LPS alpha-1,2-glucosyltransferase